MPHTTVTGHCCTHCTLGNNLITMLVEVFNTNLIHTKLTVLKFYIQPAKAIQNSHNHDIYTTTDNSNVCHICRTILPSSITNARCSTSVFIVGQVDHNGHQLSNESSSREGQYCSNKSSQVDRYVT